MRDEEDPEREAARKALELRIEELAIRREQNHDIRYTALCVAREMQQVYREEENTLKTLTIICFICLGSLIAATVAVDATAQSPKTPRADLSYALRQCLSRQFRQTICS